MGGKRICKECFGVGGKIIVDNPGTWQEYWRLGDDCSVCHGTGFSAAPATPGDTMTRTEKPGSAFPDMSRCAG